MAKGNSEWDEAADSVAWLVILQGLVAALICVLLVATCQCRSPGLVKGESGLVSQEGYTLNTSQSCQQAREAVCIAEAVLGHLRDKEPFRSRWGALTRKLDVLSICIVEQPDRCCFGVCVGPYGPAGQPARKAGCASSSTIVASVLWPPVCTPEWPDEPHCVDGPEQQHSNLYGHLVHEMHKYLLQRIPGFYGPREEPRFLVDELGAREVAIRQCGGTL